MSRLEPFSKRRLPAAGSARGPRRPRFFGPWRPSSTRGPRARARFGPWRPGARARSLCASQPSRSRCPARRTSCSCTTAARAFSRGACAPSGCPTASTSSCRTTTWPWSTYCTGEPCIRRRRWATCPRAAFLGADLALVCPECLALAPHSPCDWDLRTQPRQGAVALHEMTAFSLSRYVSRITPAWALNARKFLLSAQATGATVPRETRRPEAGLLLLHAWSRCLAFEVRRDAFDSPFDLSFMGSRGVSLHLSRWHEIIDYCRSVGQPLFFGELGELRALGAPVVEGRALTWGPFPTDAPAESRALRIYVAHLARAGSLAGRVARVATRLLVDFLAVNWCVLADHGALLRHGFHKEIAEVHVYPSFLCLCFFLETAAMEVLRLLRFRFPRAKIVWHARAQSPTALALGAIFG